MVCGLKARKVRSQYQLQWLLCAIIPNYHSISDFRKQNPSGLKTCSNSLFLLKDADLIGCEIIAIDGTKKQSAQQQESNFNQKKIERHILKSEEYLAELAKNDLQDNSITITKIAEKIERLKRINYATNRRKTKREWTTPNKYHRSRCESPFSSG
jgi:hypothetical protein